MKLLHRYIWLIWVLTSPSASGPELILLTQKAFFLVWVLYTRITLQDKENKNILRTELLKLHCQWLVTGWATSDWVKDSPSKAGVCVVCCCTCHSWEWRHIGPEDPRSLPAHSSYGHSRCTASVLKHKIKGNRHYKYKANLRHRLTCLSATCIMLCITEEPNLAPLHVTVCISDYKQTFVDVPHNSSVVDRPRHHEVSIPCPGDVIHIFYVSPKKEKKEQYMYIYIILVTLYNQLR